MGMVHAKSMPRSKNASPEALEFHNMMNARNSVPSHELIVFQFQCPEDVVYALRYRSWAGPYSTPPDMQPNSPKVPLHKASTARVQAIQENIAGALW